MPIGKGEIRRQGSRVAFLLFGTLLTNTLEAAEELDATVANMRFIKPLDEQLIKELASKHELLVTIEEGSICGGAGSGVAEYLHKNEITVSVLSLGIPDVYIEAATHQEQLIQCGLDKDGIIRSVKDRMERVELKTLQLKKVGSLQL